MTFEEINEQWLWEHRDTKDKNISIQKRRDRWTTIPHIQEQ